MTDVMQRCVPITQGELSPDMRVNYQFGLVLGVDEFVQDNLYLRERDERAARTLHGSGTATGLHVTAARPSDAILDVEVEVSPGIAIDQWGRPVVVRSAQCARIGSWIAAEENQATEDQLPSPLTTHQRPSGDVTVYVVAEYDSCLDALVPLPGNPCGTDDEVMAPSRVRDFWSLGFRWTPPESPHWHGIQDLADLLNPIELSETSLIVSDEAALADHIRALAPGASAPTLPLPARPILPRIGAREALDRLLTIWITEVRPTLTPNLIDPSGEAAILLSSITLTTAAPFDPTSPEIVSFSAPNDADRPYLAPTQLLQELAILGGGITTIIGGSPLEPAPAPILRPLIEIASLTEFTQGSLRRLILWSHLPDELILPPNVEVRRNGGAGVKFGTSAGPFANTFVLAPAAGSLNDGDLLDVHLDLTDLRVRIQAQNREFELARWLEAQGVAALGADGDDLVLHHTMSRRPPTPQPTPVRHLATATGQLVDQEVPAIELWWHVDKDAVVDEIRVPNLDTSVVRVLAEAENQPTPVELPIEVVNDVQHNVFQLVLNAQAWEATRFSPYLRVVVELGGVQVDPAGTDLASWGRDLGVQWSDAQSEGELYVAWVRMPERRS